MRRQNVFVVCPGQNVSPAHHLNKKRLRQGACSDEFTVEIIARAITHLAPFFHSGNLRELMDCVTNRYLFVSELRKYLKPMVKLSVMFVSLVLS